MHGDEESPPIVEVERLSSGYGTHVLNADMSFRIPAGEVFGILGGSGCGKSTVLKNMIGLLEPLSGRVFLEGRDLYAAHGAERREIQKRLGVMYQMGALFGSMTLMENVCLPLEEHTDLDLAARQQVARTKLALVSLAGYEHYRPDEISGGMRKRAAIARAIALDPPVIFLDEPSAGLDPITSAELDALIKSLASTLRLTFVIVTHELPSVFAIIDRAIVLDREAEGIVAIGNPHDLKANSTQPFVRRFFHRGALDESSAPTPGAGA